MSVWPLSIQKSSDHLLMFSVLCSLLLSIYITTFAQASICSNIDILLSLSIIQDQSRKAILMFLHASLQINYEQLHVLFFSASEHIDQLLLLKYPKSGLSFSNIQTMRDGSHDCLASECPKK
jgi:hypothetical protein